MQEEYIEWLYDQPASYLSLFCPGRVALCPMIYCQLHKWTLQNRALPRKGAPGALAPGAAIRGFKIKSFF